MKPFEIKDIKSFKLEDLHGKEVTLSYGKDGDSGCLVAYDKKENKIYLLANEDLRDKEEL